MDKKSFARVRAKIKMGSLQYIVSEHLALCLHTQLRFVSFGCLITPFLIVLNYDFYL